VQERLRERGGEEVTVPSDFPGAEIYDYLSEFHSGPENAVRVKDLVNHLGIDERRFREWMEEVGLKKYPLATSGLGIWFCECYEDFEESLRWRHKRLKAEARAMSKQKKCRNRHYPYQQLRLKDVA
jgi:hypothetical protein